MKYLFMLMSLLAFNVSYGQTENNDGVSKTEKFTSKAGALIQKEFIDVSRINKADVKVVHYTDLIAGESISAVRFEYEVEGGYSTDTKIASLDADEIDGLLKSIKIMQKKVFSSTPTNYTEVIYKSRGGFEAGCYWNKGVWATYLKLKQNDGKSYLFLKKDDFSELMVLLEKAKIMML